MQIYKIINKINGKIYIGKDTSSRKFYLGSGKNIKSAIKKYGKENFYKIILEDNILSNKELCDLEKKYIKEYNSTDPSIGYNISTGGDGGDTLTHNINREAINKKISESLKGRIFTEEHIQKLKDNHNSKNPEVARKISDKLKNKPKSDEHKKKLAIAISDYNKKINRWKGNSNPMKQNKYIWYSNIETGACTRIKEGDMIPEGFIKGRHQITGNNNPMNKK